jgi:flagellar basal body-associated protein FliL
MPPFTTFLFLIAFSLILMVASCWFFVCLGHFYKGKKKKRKKKRKRKKERKKEVNYFYNPILLNLSSRPSHVYMVCNVNHLHLLEV